MPATCPNRPGDPELTASLGREHSGSASTQQAFGRFFADLAREFNTMGQQIEKREKDLIRTERLAALGWRWRELPMVWDVDRPEDYRRLQGAGLLHQRRQPLGDQPVALRVGVDGI